MSRWGLITTALAFAALVAVFVVVDRRHWVGEIGPEATELARSGAGSGSQMRDDGSPPEPVSPALVDPIDPAPRSGLGLPAISPRLIAGLEAQGVPRYMTDELQVERMALSSETTQYLADAWNWFPELTKASSTLVMGGSDRPSMLQLHDISRDSILRAIGLNEGDVLVLLDEQVLEFGRRDLFDHSRRMRAAIDTLERGEPVSVTILRNGRPLHLIYESR